MSVLSKMSSFNDFQYQISNQMSHQRAFYDIFIKFQAPEISIGGQNRNSGRGDGKNLFFQKKFA